MTSHPVHDNKPAANSVHYRKFRSVIACRFVKQLLTETTTSKHIVKWIEMLHHLMLKTLLN